VLDVRVDGKVGGDFSRSGLLVFAAQLRYDEQFA
jgi:hypothetical protein